MSFKLKSSEVFHNCYDFITEQDHKLFAGCNHMWISVKLCVFLFFCLVMRLADLKAVGSNPAALNSVIIPCYFELKIISFGFVPQSFTIIIGYFELPLFQSIF